MRDDRDSNASGAVVALAGRQAMTHLSLHGDMSGGGQPLEPCHLKLMVHGLQEAPNEMVEALAYWPEKDYYFISRAGLGIVAIKVLEDQGNGSCEASPMFVVVDAFETGTSVVGLHVDKDALYILLGRAAGHGEILAVDLLEREPVQKFRLPDADTTDGPETDSPVVWGGVTTWDPSSRGRLLAITRTPPRIFSFDLAHVR